MAGLVCTKLRAENEVGTLIAEPQMYPAESMTYRVPSNSTSPGAGVEPAVIGMVTDVTAPALLYNQSVGLRPLILMATAGRDAKIRFPAKVVKLAKLLEPESKVGAPLGHCQAYIPDGPPAVAT